MNISLKNIEKTYKDTSGTGKGGNTEIQVVRNIDLEIPGNSVYGIIGKSGAGKSTLLRLVSLLERPCGGEIFYGDTRVDNLDEAGLIERRRRNGMIFQHFALFSSRNAGDNIAYPLEITGTPKAEIKKRTAALLELVGLEGRGKASISTLSGGQKQRIAIARALANKPDILFCDEATSALDPQTTHSILELIKQIQRSMSLTVVMITHQLEVARQICDFIAVLDSGSLVECGTADEVFTNPKSAAAGNFLGLRRT